MFPSFQWPSWSSELSLYPTTIYLSIIHSIWRKKWQPLLVFLPVEFYGQRSLECYSPWYKELDTTEHAHTQYTPTSSLYSHVIFPQLSFIFVLYVFTVCCCYFVIKYRKISSTCFSSTSRQLFRWSTSKFKAMILLLIWSKIAISTLQIFWKHGGNSIFIVFFQAKDQTSYFKFSYFT